MLLKNTLLYMPAQIVGPLAQLVAMIVWTHVVDEPTLGVITLVTATHELLQIAFLAWWSQYALRFLGRYQDDGDTARFYRTENAVLLSSVVLQSLIVVAILFMVIAPQANGRLVGATVAYVATRTLNLYLADRARVQHQIAVYSIQVTVGPALGFVIGLILIKLVDRSAEWPLVGYAIAQLAAALIVLPKIGCGRGLWPLDRDIINHAARYGVPLIIGGALGWVGLNASRFVVNEMLGVAAAGLFAVGYGLGQRAATFAAMLVTAAAYPIAVKSMERHGAKVAMRQLADNSALLIAILAPCITGIFMLRQEIVHLLIAPAFQQVTLAILPLSVLAGSIRSLRAHFVDQTFLLHHRTGLLAIVTTIDATVTLALSFIFVSRWGLTGAAGATVVAAVVAASTSFAIAFLRFGLTLPLEHLAPLTVATAIMAAVLNMMPEASSLIVLASHVALGAAIYAAALAVFYAPALLKMLRLRQQQSET
ncbi:oligosaccharide flippase family protein [Bradyrhizobium sp. ARR65]|uniref:lipopolysaccharide biosynthesis protein n=1 Tax=Bradyrhizobium sp. ARR65 TaxID=1040989 RepID=UPI000465438C|nr:oligosaccharide flippase family protein [Bradyrhizobium sp. ARR65]